MEEVKYLGETIRRWRIGPSAFLAHPKRGARLMNWNISYADGSFRDIIRWPELDSIDQLVKARGGNPILFPFCARTFHQGEIQKWKDPSGKVRPMPMHGFARQGSFEITRLNKSGFAARLLPNKEARQSYPFEYEFEVVYRFSEYELDVELRLSNLDRQPIPWSAGHHFYFNLPWADGTARRDYQTTIHARKACRHAPSGELVPLPSPSSTPTRHDDPQLVDRIHYDLADRLVRCDCPYDDSKIEIEVGTSAKPHPDYAIVTWTEAEDSPFYCIEPWMGPPNSPENQVGYHLVQPGETSRFCVAVRV